MEGSREVLAEPRCVHGIVTTGIATLECHAGCACPVAACAVRASQRGPWPPLCVKKTKERGWGLFTRSALDKQAIVTEYVGELLSAEESSRRAVGYDEEGLNYLIVVREEKVSTPS
jgi:histone-lysine N-methyltransferase SUV39H